MKNIIKIMICVLLLGSCADYLDQYPYGNYNDEENWQNQSFVQGLVGKAYDYMQRHYAYNGGYFLDGATDDAVITSTSHSLNRLATGALVPGGDPFWGYWRDDYQAIASVNLFLKDRRGYNSKFLLDNNDNELVRTRLQGEAFALRAWFQWDLLKRFGGRSDQGELLGFPIVLEPLMDYARDLDTRLNVPRNSYEECMAQIQADCDSAYKYLPIAHRDFIADEKKQNKQYAGGRYWGRMDGITTRAILADMYLTWASPLYNPNNEMSRWEKAAAYAKEVIDFKLNVDGKVSNGFNPKSRVLWTNPNFPGIVFSSRVQGSSSTNINVTSDNMERSLYPSGYQGYGEIGATQNLVDAFPMKNGYPIDHPNSGYDPADPYKDRDPRLYSIIFYNGAQVKKDNTGTLWYTFENWGNRLGNTDEGKDAAGRNGVSRTNYHIKKFISMKVNWSESTVTMEPHSRFFYRWAHMILMFAEAANEIEGPNGSQFGLSAKEAIQYLRTRNTYDNATLFNTDPYLDEAAMDKDSFREFIKNERRIETCFEGMRFYDQRRWARSVAELNQPVYRATVTYTGNDNEGKKQFTYGKEVVDNRVFNSLYLPIPYTEMLRMDKLVQNEGWDGWK